MVKVGVGIRPRSVEGTNVSHEPMSDEGGSETELSLGDPVAK